MTRRAQLLYELQSSSDLGKSIFPVFDINVPMPTGTAVPPSIQTPSAPSQPAQADSAAATDEMPT